MPTQSIYVLLSLSALMCNAFSSYPTEAFRKRGTQKYCGKEINEALRMICHSYYNSMFINKRNGGDQEGIDFGEYQVIPNERREELIRPADMDAFVAAIQSLRYPFASKATSLTMLPGTRTNGNYIREKRGVYDECCKKSCSINELATYCGDN